MMNTNNPVAFLKNEHKALLGQLGILERMEGGRNEITTVLKTLIRDCSVHFGREAILFNELDTKLGAGGRSLHPLIKEHRDLKKHAATILKELSQPNRASQGATSIHHTLREFTHHFRAHIQHEEKVVFLLAETRLTKKVQLSVLRKMLAT